jgi:hypothetical protein
MAMALLRFKEGKDLARTLEFEVFIEPARDLNPGEQVQTMADSARDRRILFDHLMMHRASYLREDAKRRLALGIAKCSPYWQEIISVDVALAAVAETAP